MMLKVDPGQIEEIEKERLFLGRVLNSNIENVPNIVIEAAQRLMEELDQFFEFVEDTTDWSRQQTEE
jgi:hypothetical protein